MLQYTPHQLATIVAIPMVSILTVWTVAIFHKNRRQWRPYDVTVVAVLVQSLLRQAAIFCYTMLTILHDHHIAADLCTPTVWVFNCLHTFQASTLTTLALVGLFSVKLARKQQNIKQFLNVTHLVYHLFCLTTLCACVGVAAILARKEKSAAFFEFDDDDAASPSHNLQHCKFLPFQLDVKYNVFIIALLAFLALISVSTFAVTVYNYFKLKYSAFDYLQKSTSDLSDLSLGIYDTLKQQVVGWNSDTSNISTSVSSTNSRRPCLAKEREEDDNGAGLETVLPVLIVCYLFYHLPVVVLCTFPWITSPWPVSGALLWLGILQDLLIPVGLGLVDSRFCTWVSRVYRCTDRRGADKLLHGVDGKFRPFGSQPQSLEVMQIPGQDSRGMRGHHVEHKFPITNGSLYTSIDGRVPVIHNYRRHNKVPIVTNAVNHIKRQEFILNQAPPLPPHYDHILDSQSAFISLPSECNTLNVASVGNQRRHLVLNQNHLKPSGAHHSQSNHPPITIPRNLSASQASLNNLTTVIENDLQKLRARNMNFVIGSTNTMDKHVETSDEEDDDDEDGYLHGDKSFDTLSSQSCYSITTEANCDFEFYGNSGNSNNSSSINNISNINNNNCSNKDQNSQQLQQQQQQQRYHYIKNELGETSDTMTSAVIPQVVKISAPQRITRSNSKRSLESFQAFQAVAGGGSIVSHHQHQHMETEAINKQLMAVKRSNSDANRNRHVIVTGSGDNVHHIGGGAGGGNLRANVLVHHRNASIRRRSPGSRRIRTNNTNHINNKSAINSVMSMECLHSVLNSRQDDISYLDNGDLYINHGYGGSVPDFKRIFVSEYI